jgi:D-sedoheptulose 7-phosphate isomerase
VKALLDTAFAEHQDVLSSTLELCEREILEVGTEMVEVLAKGGTIFWCGNGGSAADSQHLAAELVGRFKADRRALRSLALSTDTSVLTCVGNDFGFEQIFSRQVEALGRPGDLLVAISTSGKSANAVSAVDTARKAGIATAGLLGGDGGDLASLVDRKVIVPSGNTARIQEMHILIGHCLCELIENGLGVA